MNVQHRVDNARCLFRRLSLNMHILNLGPRYRVLQIDPQCQDLVTSGVAGVLTQMVSAQICTRWRNISRRSTAERMTLYSVATHGVRFSIHSASHSCKIHYTLPREKIIVGQRDQNTNKMMVRSSHAGRDVSLRRFWFRQKIDLENETRSNVCFEKHIR